MRIGDREIGPGRAPYVIAELGVNHDGDAARALDLVHAAARAGADAVKLQWFRADLLMGGSSRLAAYQREAGEHDARAMLRRLELDDGAMARTAGLAHSLGLHAIVTVFSVELVGAAGAIAWDAFKTASPDIIHRPLLDALAATGRPMIVSTGAATLDEVLRAASWLAPARGRTAFLQCVSSYPTPEGVDGLGGMRGLAAALSGVPIGYSDHTRGVEAGRKAARWGACILEKHLTYDPSARGPDHAASLSPEAFAAYVRGVREGWEEARAAGVPGGAEAARALGPLVKEVLPCEADVREVSRQSITARRALKAGRIVTREDVTFKRPGRGIEPWRIGGVIGAVLARDVPEDGAITDQDIVRPARAAAVGGRHG